MEAPSAVVVSERLDDKSSDPRLVTLYVTLIMAGALG
jgi:hypothetical protein